MATDTLIRNARIIDGTGAPWFAGDVRLRDGKIAAIGPRLTAEGAETVEAEGAFWHPVSSMRIATTT